MARDLPELEEVLDRSGAAELIEPHMPSGGRPRQLPVRSLLLGIMLCLADDRPALLSRAHGALVSLPSPERERLCVTVSWRGGPHELTYRQFEHTFGSLAALFCAEMVDGRPGPLLSAVTDALVEASIPDDEKGGRDLAVDWTDVESFARPGRSGRPSYDPDASFGHRRGDAPGKDHEVFFGYYLQLATMTASVGSPRKPELVRRMLLTSCHVDPPPAFVPVLVRLWGSGVSPGDVLSDCGYSERVARNWALPLRAAGASLVHDLHPNDRGTKGTFGGAVVWCGELYCPATPASLFALGPLSRKASKEETAAHDRTFSELSSYRLSRICSDDADGYHRVVCPAVADKLRCPLRPESMSRPYDRPEIATVPQHPQTCCTQKTMTVPPTVAEKTAQHEVYPGPQWRKSYARRSGAERSNATLKDPARVSIEKGWCRVAGLPAVTIMLACLVVVRNLRVVDSFEENERRATTTTTRTRRRRRTSLDELAASTRPPP